MMNTIRNCLRCSYENGTSAAAAVHVCYWTTGAIIFLCVFPYTIQVTDHLYSLVTVNCTHELTSTILVINCPHSDADEASQSDAIESFLENDELLNIDALTITMSRLMTFPSRICDFVYLRELHLDENRISQLPNGCLLRLKHLEQFTADGNRLKFLQDGLFDGLQKLVKLSFRVNQIESIGLNLFSNRSDLPKLKEILLDDNRISVLEPWIYIRGQVVEDGVTISLKRNAISKFTNEIGWRFTCGMKSFALDVFLNRNNITHLIDHVKGFKFTRMTDYLCMHVPTSYGKIRYTLDGNPLNCDCKDFPILRILDSFPFTVVLDKLYCSSPPELAGKRVIALQLERFSCQVYDNCPNFSRCLSIPANLTMKVNSSATGLRELPLVLPLLKTTSYRYDLDFSKNLISTLSSRPYLHNKTCRLDISRSGVEMITDEAWLVLLSVDHILLHENHLKTLSDVIMTRNHSFKSLSLYGNPLSCECQNVWVKHWLISVKDRLVIPDSILCSSPEWLNKRSIFSIKDEEHCNDPDKSKHVAIISSVTCGSLILIVVLSLAVVHALRVHLFATFNVHPFDRDECRGEEMDYDIFLTCCNEDRNQAMTILMLLEGHHFRVCYHERDFLGGQTIADNICLAVARSKRVLCLVSEGFLQSSYCNYEFEIALHRSAQLKKKRLVVLLLEKIDVRGANVPREMQEYLSTHTIVEYWSANWERSLLYAMPTIKLGNSTEETPGTIRELFNRENGSHQLVPI